jgi:hypothetical protein
MSDLQEIPLPTFRLIQEVDFMLGFEWFNELTVTITEL